MTAILSYYPRQPVTYGGQLETLDSLGPPEPLFITVTDSKAQGLEEKMGPFVDLRIGMRKAVRIAWLTPEDARRLGCILIVLAAKAEKVQEQESES